VQGKIVAMVAKDLSFCCVARWRSNDGGIRQKSKRLPPSFDRHPATQQKDELIIFFLRKK